MGSTQKLPDSQGGRMWEILSSGSTAKEGGHCKYSLVARQPTRRKVGNTQELQDCQGGRTREILSSCQTTKEGGRGKYSSVFRQPRRDEMKYSLCARQPRTEDVGITYLLTYNQERRTWEICIRCQTSKREGHREYPVVVR